MWLFNTTTHIIALIYKNDKIPPHLVWAQNVHIVNKTTPTRAKKICDINTLDMHQLSGSHVLLFDLQLGIVKGPSVIT